MNREVYIFRSRLSIILGVVFILLLFFNPLKFGNVDLTLIIISFYSILIGILVYNIKENEQTKLTNFALVLILITFIIAIITLILGIISFNTGGYLSYFIMGFFLSGVYLKGLGAIPLGTWLLTVLLSLSLSLLIIDKFIKKTWNLFFLLVVIVLIVILPLVANYSYIKRPLLVSEKFSNPKQCEGDNGCLWQFVKTAQDSKACGLMTGSYNDKDRCYKKMAVSMADVTLCEKINRQLWRDGCFRDLGIKLSDKSLCEVILDKEQYGVCDCGIRKEELDRDKCFHDLAIKFNNSNRCLGISDTSKEESCLNIFI